MYICVIPSAHIPPSLIQQQLLMSLISYSRNPWHNTPESGDINLLFFYLIIFNENKGNKQEAKPGKDQWTGTFNNAREIGLVDGELWGQCGKKKKKLWHGRGVWKEETHRDGEREREKKAKEEVNYLPLLSNTSSNSWGVSSSVAAAHRAFHLTDVMGDEGSSPSHLKSVTIHLHAGNFRAEGALCGELLEIQIQDH